MLRDEEMLFEEENFPDFKNSNNNKVVADDLQIRPGTVTTMS